MKLAPYITILILLLLLIFGWLHFTNKTGKLEQKYLREKLDSAIKPHQQAIVKIEEARKKLLVKVKSDSLKHEESKLTFRKEISVLRRQLKAVKYTGDPSTVPDDSVQIAMQALEEAPLKDSIIAAQEKENVRLNSQIATIHDDYSGLMDGYQQEINHKDKIISDWKAGYERLEDLNKKQRKKGLINGVKIALVALGAGFVIGISR